jgi:hypothetical protein
LHYDSVGSFEPSDLEKAVAKQLAFKRTQMVTIKSDTLKRLKTDPAGALREIKRAAMNEFCVLVNITPGRSPEGEFLVSRRETMKL